MRKYIIYFLKPFQACKYKANFKKPCSQLQLLQTKFGNIAKNISIYFCHLLVGYNLDIIADSIKWLKEMIF